MYKTTVFIIIILSIISLLNAQTEIVLEQYFRSLKSVKVEINDNLYHFLFDSGAGITMISPEIAEELHKPVYGNYVGFRMSGEKVEMQLCDSVDITLNGMDFFHPYVAVFDMMSLLPKELERIDGMISLQTFENNEITVDLENNKLIVETEESFTQKIKNMSEIPSHFANGQSGLELNIFVGITAKTHLWWFLFDTGNIAKTKISKNIAQEWDFSLKENEITEIGNYTFDIAGESITVPTIIDDIIYDGALSYDFIQQSIYAISFIDKKIWIEKQGTVE